MLEASRLFDIPHYQLKNYPNPNMFVTKTNGQWIGVSTAEFLDHAMRVSKGLFALGVKAGDNVALVSNTRYEWNVMDIAIQQVGAIVVPLYPNISEGEYRYIMKDASIQLCVLSNEELFEKISHIKGDVETLKHVYSFEVVSGCDNWKMIEEAGNTRMASRRAAVEKEQQKRRKT